MNWLVLAGSLAAVFTVAGLVWLMGMGKPPAITDADHATQLARDAHSGFRAADAIVDAQGRAALVAGESGEFVLVRPHGAQIAARVFKQLPRTRFTNGKLVIETGEATFGDVALDIPEADARRWERLLEGAIDA